jgi:hypothetical protein
MAVKQDCPTGLARCIDGVVEVSAGRSSCPSCPCAWTRQLGCPSGCAIENEELVREPNEAASLCKSLQVPATRPALDAGSATCPNEGERFLCQAGTVWACPKNDSAVPVAVCTRGCAREGETLEDPRVDVGGATSVMCIRDNAVVDP